MLDMLQSPLGRFRVLAFAEGLSFLFLLFAAMPLKYLWNSPTPNKVVGSLHGLLFVLYVYEAIRLKTQRNWKIGTLLQLLLASVLPFGTFWADKKILRPMEQDC